MTERGQQIARLHFLRNDPYSAIRDDLILVPFLGREDEAPVDAVNLSTAPSIQLRLTMTSASATDLGRNLSSSGLTMNSSLPRIGMPSGNGIPRTKRLAENTFRQTSHRVAFPAGFPNRSENGSCNWIIWESIESADLPDISDDLTE